MSETHEDGAPFFFATQQPPSAAAIDDDIYLTVTAAVPPFRGRWRRSTSSCRSITPSM